MKCRYSAVALDDLMGIAKYIAQDNPKRARSFVAELRATCITLARQPGMGRLRTDLGVGVRFFPHGNYVILFSVVNGGVLIERVMHDARDLPMAIEAPTQETIEAMKATRAMDKARFRSAQELFDDLRKVAKPKTR
jgi:toxin ParE1/3/4